MSFKDWLLSEMPITNWQMKGDWSPNARKRGYNAQDIGILTNPKGVEKIRRTFAKATQNFDFYFVRSPQAYKHYEVGQVTPEWVQKNLQLEIEPNPDAITVIYTGNRAAEKMPMNAWTIAHRLGHALRSENLWQQYIIGELTRNFRDVLSNVYGIDAQYGFNWEPAMLALSKAIGTMKSARDGTLRNSDEFPFEMLAQYLLTGEIRFNDLPTSLVTGSRFGRPTNRLLANTGDLSEWSEIVKDSAGTYKYYFGELLKNFDGKIFVM